MKLGKCFKATKAAAISKGLGLIERVLAIESSSDSPLFLVGAPRSGTTLAYQIITSCLRVSYFCNLANRYPDAPLGASWLMKSRIVKGSASDFESSYGHVTGNSSPSQGDRIWARYFGGDRSYHEQFGVGEAEIFGATRLVQNLAGLVGAPFVNKSIANSVKVQLLAAAFPSSRFIWIRRNPLLQTQSHYFNLLRQPGSGWMSAKPSNFTTIRNLPLAEKAAAQVMSIEKDIADALANIDRGRWMSVGYEMICDDPGGFLARVVNLWGPAIHRVERRGNPPESFEASNSIKLGKEELAAAERMIGNFL